MIAKLLAATPSETSIRLGRIDANICLSTEIFLGWISDHGVKHVVSCHVWYLSLCTSLTCVLMRLSAVSLPACVPCVPSYL